MEGKENKQLPFESDAFFRHQQQTHKPSPVLSKSEDIQPHSNFGCLRFQSFLALLMPRFAPRTPFFIPVLPPCPIFLAILVAVPIGLHLLHYRGFFFLLFNTTGEFIE